MSKDVTEKFQVTIFFSRNSILIYSGYSTDPAVSTPKFTSIVSDWRKNSSRCLCRHRNKTTRLENKQDSLWVSKLLGFLEKPCLRQKIACMACSLSKTLIVAWSNLCSALRKCRCIPTCPQFEILRPVIIRYNKLWVWKFACETTPGLSFNSTFSPLTEHLSSIWRWVLVVSRHERSHGVPNWPTLSADLHICTKNSLWAQAAAVFLFCFINNPSTFILH